MLNLNDWIKAQLKSGYPMERITNIIRCGYSQKAVAGIGKARYSALPARTLPGKKISKKVSYKAIVLIPEF